MKVVEVWTMPNDSAVAPGPRNGIGRFALQLGVVAVVTALIPVAGDFIAAPAALTSLVLGTVGYLRVEKGAGTNPIQAIAGAILGLSAGLLIFITYVITAAAP
ncbi:hypothetical protein [Pseudactinotalea sp. Z1732]|uniref:hypothetical protein n=1 Tax=Micrococcales TaxID=85006 RepID=UPI003C79D563